MGPGAGAIPRPLPGTTGLAALPPGTVLDGELIVTSQGLPDLEAILARHHLTHPAKIEHISRQQPVSYPISCGLFLNPINSNVRFFESHSGRLCGGSELDRRKCRKMTGSLMGRPRCFAGLCLRPPRAD